MENKFDELIGLKNEYIDLAEWREQVWVYHPSNEGFINPIKLYDELSAKLSDLERKINELERKINSVN